MKKLLTLTAVIALASAFGFAGAVMADKPACTPGDGETKVCIHGHSEVVYASDLRGSPGARLTLRGQTR